MFKKLHSHEPPTIYSQICEWTHLTGVSLYKAGTVARIDPPVALRWETGRDGSFTRTDDAHGKWRILLFLKVRGQIYKAGVVVDTHLAVADARFLTQVLHSEVGEDGSLPGLCLRVADRAVHANPVLSAVNEMVRVLHTHNVPSLGVVYKPYRRFPELFAAFEKGFDPSWFAPDFLALIFENKAAFTEILPNELYSFPLFTPAFCDHMLDETEALNEYAAQHPNVGLTRPNSMNNYGVVMEQVGLGAVLDELITTYLLKVVRRLFPDESELDSNHSFTVKYKMGEDRGLDMHTDDSEITLNVCLGRDFKGAKLNFCGHLGDAQHRKLRAQVAHKVGTCLVHRGRLRHGSEDISEGERTNLIMWLRSSEYRKSREHRTPPYQKESSPPDPVCTSFTHDRDYGVWKDYNPATMHTKGHGWCPPEQFEYDGFIAEESGA